VKELVDEKRASWAERRAKKIVTQPT